MAVILYQTNNKAGITYAYDSIFHWDKEIQQSRAKHKCLGKIDPITNKIIPTKNKTNDLKDESMNSSEKMETISKPVASRNFYGATYLFDVIGKKLGLLMI